VIVERPERWGKLRYDTLQHKFSCVHTGEKNAIPYAHAPVVLNIDLTMKCNMDCLYCVAKDFSQTEDLVISRKLLDWIHKSPFMVVVITGGEPLLPEYQNNLMTLLRETHDKGLVVDTNGSIFPSSSVVRSLLDTSTMVRVSWDTPQIYDEIRLRQVKLDKKPDEGVNKENYYKKIDTIRRLLNSGVKVAVQTVVYKGNSLSVFDMPKALRQHSISRWYLQRLVPSYKATSESYQLTIGEYTEIAEKLVRKCQRMGIECITKKDRRHNCVFLLVGGGILYTQGEEPRQKIRLGTIDDEIGYWDYVSSADHAVRYYG